VSQLQFVASNPRPLFSQFETVSSGQMTDISVQLFFVSLQSTQFYIISRDLDKKTQNNRNQKRRERGERGVGGWGEGEKRHACRKKSKERANQTALSKPMCKNVLR
jgi:hypothetical protein